MKNVYFKSFGTKPGSPILETSAFNPREGYRTCQTLDEAVKTRLLKTNTNHRDLPVRLAVSLPCRNFPGVYRPEGLLFTTDMTPSYAVPFDKMALTRGDTLTSRDHDFGLLPGYKQFVFRDADSMKKAFPNARSALVALNDFRSSHGLKPVRGVSYNEICFEEDIVIEPVAVVGTSLNLRSVGWSNHLKRFPSVADYLNHKDNPMRYLFGAPLRFIETCLASSNEMVSNLAPERKCDLQTI